MRIGAQINNNCVESHRRFTERKSIKWAVFTNGMTDLWVRVKQFRMINLLFRRGIFTKTQIHTFICAILKNRLYLFYEDTASLKEACKSRVSSFPNPVVSSIFQSI
jgi:hypothetical protein